MKISDKATKKTPENGAMERRNDFIRNLFNQVDKDGSGSIDKNEFRMLCNDMEISASELEELFKDIDVDDNDHITFEEFAAGFDRVTELIALKSQGTQVSYSLVTDAQKSWEDFLEKHQDFAQKISKPNLKSARDLYTKIYLANRTFSSGLVDDFEDLLEKLIMNEMLSVKELKNWRLSEKDEVSIATTDDDCSSVGQASETSNQKKRRRVRKKKPVEINQLVEQATENQALLTHIASQVMRMSEHMEEMSTESKNEIELRKKMYKERKESCCAII